MTPNNCSQINYNMYVEDMWPLPDVSKTSGSNLKYTPVHPFRDLVIFSDRKFNETKYL